MDTNLAPTPSAIESVLTHMGYPTDTSLCKGLSVYLSLLLKWNRALNLTGIHHWQKILTHLVVDSFHLADALTVIRPPLTEKSVLADLGAGCGLPGIPLRLLNSTGTYLLIEKREKRAIFLKNVLAQLTLPKTSVVHAACEDFFRERPSCADLVLSKAFLPWPKLLQLVPPYLSPCGQLMVLASEKPGETPGWQITHTCSWKCENSTHWLWCLEANHRQAHP